MSSESNSWQKQKTASEHVLKKILSFGWGLHSMQSMGDRSLFIRGRFQTTGALKSRVPVSVSSFGVVRLKHATSLGIHQQRWDNLRQSLQQLAVMALFYWTWFLPVHEHFSPRYRSCSSCRWFSKPKKNFIHSCQGASHNHINLQRWSRHTGHTSPASGVFVPIQVTCQYHRTPSTQRCL